MRKLLISILFIVVGGILFYSSNWFQSTFLPDRFYKDIFNTRFDVTKKGESISIPLKFKFKTCYSLEIAVHDKDLFHSREPLSGILKYRFTSNGLVAAEGLTHPPSNRHMVLYRGISSIIIMIFDLPFNGKGDGLTLDLEVVEPMSFLAPFSGEIHCKVSPSYDAKLGKCHGETVRVVHQINRLQSAGNNGYTDDKQGTRIIWNSGGKYTRYEYPPDWYGYCLDDPVNGVDPLGLLAWFLPLAVGMAGATAIGATGAYSAAKAVDWLGKKTNTDYGKDKPTATAGVHDAMGKVIGINAGIVGAAGAAKVAPAAAAAAMRHPEKLAAGSKAAVDFASGAFDQGPPPASKAGYSGVAASKAYDWLKTRRQNESKAK